MENAIQKVENVPVSLVQKSQQWTQEEIQLIQDTVAQGTSPEEFKLFLYTASQRGLNPLLKQIYCIMRKKKNPDGTWGASMTIQTGIDGFRLIANRTKKLAGIERGVRYNEKGRLYAWCKVYRKDWAQPAYEEVPLSEYKGDSALWGKMPETMLKKCAEACALRIAFPEDLSGLYASEEMDQADRVEKFGPVDKKEVTEAENAFREAQKQAKLTAAQITKLVAENGIKQEEFEWITGFQTLKGLSQEQLNNALQILQETIKANKLADSVGTP